MKKRMALMLFVLALIFGGIFAWKVFVGHMMRQMLAHRARPPAVSVATARLTEWAPRLRSVASLSAVRGVEVSTPLAGKITRILFRSG
ncbi:MAG TPA: efflux RND transporter periplasmic adaptor subunit, partial [Chromatiales bacterium]|nr:efflux RND transporter periplasmic adaptor subunit [Chromatiales bacterium]